MADAAPSYAPPPMPDPLGSGGMERKLVLVMVGLPARGKTYTARKVARYLSWLGYSTRVFNVGNYRRARVGAYQSHEFFAPENPEGSRARRELAQVALEDLVEWLGSRGDVAIYDATNTTRVRRSWVAAHCVEQGFQVVFVENICDDATIIDANVRDTKLSSPDYVDVDPEEAVRDFRARIAHYEEVYEPVEVEEGSFVKLIDMSRQVVTNRIEGYIPARLVFFLMNLHTVSRPIWLTRHGESAFNVLGRIGGDAELTSQGEAYAKVLAELAVERLGGRDDFVVWTSTLRRTLQTARHLGKPPVVWRSLDEIDAGVCDGMTYAQIAVQLPDEFEARRRDKFRYRYPRGESYFDVIQRLDPVIIELERQRRPVLVIAHQAVLRALYAYFSGLPPQECPHLQVPLHTVIELVPRAYGCDEQRFTLLPTTTGQDRPSDSG